MSKVGEKRPKTGGRKKGTPNKVTGEIKQMVLQALENKGGTKYLERQAESNPVAFMTLLGKVLPLQLTGPDDGAVELVTRIELVDGDSEG